MKLFLCIFVLLFLQFIVIEAQDHSGSSGEVNQAETEILENEKDSDEPLSGEESNFNDHDELEGIESVREEEKEDEEEKEEISHRAYSNHEVEVEEITESNDISEEDNGRTGHPSDSNHTAEETHEEESSSDHTVPAGKRRAPLDAFYSALKEIQRIFANFFQTVRSFISDLLSSWGWGQR